MLQSISSTECLAQRIASLQDLAQPCSHASRVPVSTSEQRGEAVVAISPRRRAAAAAEVNTT